MSENMMEKIQKLMNMPSSKGEPLNSERKNTYKKRNIDQVENSNIQNEKSEEDISYMKTKLLQTMSEGMDSTWSKLLKEEFSKPYFDKILDFLVQEKNSKKVVLPPEENIFEVLKYPFDDIKVVIIGQDPYIYPKQAHGLSFSVNEGVKIPDSLDNIFTEIKSSYSSFNKPKHGCLKKWVEQGICLLNASLTVRKGEFNSHSGKWDEFTDAIIGIIAEKRRNVVFLLFGNFAKGKSHLVEKYQSINEHRIIKTTHPSPRSASFGFFGSQCFLEVNNFLQSKNQKIIDWNL